MIGTRVIRALCFRAARIVPGAAVIALTVSATPGGTIALLDEARAAAGEPVTLGMVARLEGEDALALRDLVLAPSVSELAGERAWAELSIDDLRRALSKNKVNLTRHAISGASCLLRLTDASAAERSSDNGPARAAPAGPFPAAMATGATIRDEVTRALLAFHRAEASRLRVTFDPRDDEFLSRRCPVPGNAAGRVSVTPSTAGGSSRGVLRVRVYDGERITDDRSIRADVELFQRVVVPRSEIRRKDTIEAADLDEPEMWIAPGTEPAASIDDVAGSIARARLAAGEVLRRDQVESPIIVKKGDLLTVHCISDGVEITTRARAVKPGRLGERIEVRAEGSKRGYLATIDGRGRAVVAMHGERPGDGESVAREGAANTNDEGAMAPRDEGTLP